MEKPASQARIFDSNERSILSKTTVKQGTGWNGVAAHTTHLRTCDLELPRRHATVKCGRFDLWPSMLRALDQTSWQVNTSKSDTSSISLLAAPIRKSHLPPSNPSH